MALTTFTTTTTADSSESGDYDSQDAEGGVFATMNQSVNSVVDMAGEQRYKIAGLMLALVIGGVYFVG